MPEMTLGVIVFCTLSAMVFSGAVLWLVGRKAGASRRKNARFPYAFLAGSVTFSLVYILNRLAFPLHPKTTGILNLALLSVIPAIPLLRKKARRLLRRKKTKRHHRQPEAAALEQMLKRDPLNAFCLEQLSEIYQEMGEHDRALEAACKALKLDPTIKNQWRVDDLTKEIHEKRRHTRGWKRQW